MAKTSEVDFGITVMRVLSGQPRNEATVRTLIEKIPSVLSLTPEDRELSLTRKGEEMWEQRVRNLKSHSRTTGNVLSKGFVAHIGRGRYKLTDAGKLHLSHR